MKRVIILSCLLIAITGSLYAKTNRYRLSWRADPATTMVIGWNQNGGSNPMVHFGEVDMKTDWDKYPSSHSVDRQSDYGLLDNRFARLTDLKPNTAYYFVIHDSNSTSNRFWFKTASDKADPFSFIAGGDSRTHKAPRKDGNRLVAKLRPLFVLFGGDYTSEGTPRDWDKWLKDWQLTISEDRRIYPILAAHGNHENDDMQMVYKIFDTPHPDMYFSLSINNNLLKIWTLNTELESNTQKWSEQLNWFKTDLQTSSADATWKVVDYHRPMRPHASHKAEGITQINSWAQLFYDYRIDLVVESDTHMVKRTYPLRPSTEEGSFESFIRDDAEGTVFIGEGSWGAPKRNADDNKPWTLASDSFYQFKWIHIHQNKLESRVVKFENVKKVEALTEENLFEIPENIVFWQPESGEVLTLPFKQD